MKEMFKAQTNSPQTKLSNSITASATSINLEDASKLPDAPNLAVIGAGENCETIKYTGKTGNTLTGVTRGFEGSAQSWSVGVAVSRNFTAYDYNSLVDNLKNLSPGVRNLVLGNANTYSFTGNGGSNQIGSLNLFSENNLASMGWRADDWISISYDWNVVGDGFASSSFRLQFNAAPSFFTTATGCKNMTFTGTTVHSNGNPVINISDTNRSGTITMEFQIDGSNSDILSSLAQRFTVRMDNIQNTVTLNISNMKMFKGTQEVDKLIAYEDGGQVFNPGTGISGTTSFLKELRYVTALSDTATNLVGTLKIVLPGGWSNSRIALEIFGVDYGTNTGAYKLTLGGFLSQPNSAWSQLSGTVTGNAPFAQVRFGYDGTNVCILLGTTTTVWNQHKVIVTRVIASSSGGNLITPTGWSMSRITSESEITVSGTINELRPTVASADKWTTGRLLNGALVDGTVNANIPLRNVRARSSDANNKWVKIAGATVELLSIKNVVFHVFNAYVQSFQHQHGILKCSMRIASGNVPQPTLIWENLSGFDVNDFIMVYSTPVNNITNVELWVRCPDSNTSYHFNVIAMTTHTAESDSWSLYNGSTPQAAPTEGYTQKVSEWNPPWTTGDRISINANIDSSTLGTPARSELYIQNGRVYIYVEWSSLPTTSPNSAYTIINNIQYPPEFRRYGIAKIYNSGSTPKLIGQESIYVDNNGTLTISTVSQLAGTVIVEIDYPIKDN